MKCPACNNETGNKHVSAVGCIQQCGACGAIFGECPENVSFWHVLPLWHKGESKPEDERYYDFSGKTAEGKPYRRHGWYNRYTRQITQVG